MLEEYISWGVMLAEPDSPRGRGLAETRAAVAAMMVVNLANILKYILFVCGDWLDLI
jgi:hypothetical protein